MVDLDPAMTRLFSGHSLLADLNRQAFASPKVTVLSKDAFIWLKDAVESPATPQFDAVIIDVPDPSNFSIGKLYSVSFYRLLHNIIDDNSRIVVQSTSPLVARKSFWCVNNTLEAAGFNTTPYHAYVPSFGEWGFVMAGRSTYRMPAAYPDGLRYVSIDTAREMFHFPADMARVDTKIQKLDDQALIHYFEEEWARYLVY